MVYSVDKDGNLRKNGNPVSIKTQNRMFPGLTDRKRKKAERRHQAERTFREACSETRFIVERRRL